MSTEPKPQEGLRAELERRITAARKEADDIRFYSGGSKFNASQHSLADWMLNDGGKAILAALPTAHVDVLARRQGAEWVPTSGEPK